MKGLRRTRYLCILVLIMGLALLAAGCGGYTEPEETANYRTADDLKGKIVGTQLGSSGETACNKIEGLKDLKLYERYPDAFNDLKNGRLDVLVVDEVTARHFINQSEEQFEVVGEKLNNEPFGIGIRKEDTDLKAAIDQALLEMQEDGTMKNISEKWFGEDIVNIKADSKPNINQDQNLNTLQQIKEKGVLVAGLDDTFAPMGYRDKDNNLIGFDIDMGEELAKRLGVKMEWQPTDWNGVILSLKSKKFDVVISGMSITPERQKEINFSTPYLDAGLVMVVSK
ncbi:transporter substrate-binding domain-containing protein [Desulfolucanica intricata]|uniref:transporter substrate-binding domain-containing protein n=1 Tax=Desulfolucanica intricata TaxID=1285191 RepID=UPI000832DC38|nr:transporter substrate-binding domain-containing protein [Desulfolucanica intricata]